MIKSLSTAKSQMIIKFQHSYLIKSEEEMIYCLIKCTKTNNKKNNNICKEIYIKFKTQKKMKNINNMTILMMNNMKKNINLKQIKLIKIKTKINGKTNNNGQIATINKIINKIGKMIKVEKIINKLLKENLLNL